VDRFDDLTRAKKESNGEDDGSEVHTEEFSRCCPSGEGQQV